MPTTPRPYEAGSALAEHVEDVTGDTAEAFNFTHVVPVVITDPVRIEERATRTLVAETFTTETPVRILPASTTRARAVVSVLDTINSTGCYIGGPGVTPSTGFRLPHNGQVELSTSGEVWAMPITGDEVAVSVLVEHRG